MKFLLLALLVVYGKQIDKYGTMKYGIAMLFGFS